MDLSPHGAWLNTRSGGFTRGRRDCDRPHSGFRGGTSTYVVFALLRPNAVPYWRSGVRALVPVFGFLQPVCSGVSLPSDYVWFHRWFHLWQQDPTIGGTLRLSSGREPNDGTGPARRLAQHQEWTCHARKEGLRSAILRLPRRDENAQGLCSPLAPSRAILVFRRTRLGACVWRPEAGMQRGVASL